MTVIAINAVSLAAAAASGAPAAARAGAAIAGEFAQLLADELQQVGPMPPAQVPSPAPPAAVQAYPWIAVPVALPCARDDKAQKKRPPSRGDRRSGRR